MRLFCYSKCSTCRKVEKYLNDRQIDYQSRDIKGQKPNQDELRHLYQKSGLPLKRFFNTSGQVYRNLGLKNKLTSMTEDQQLALLATDGMLVKRPILEGEDFVLVGFREKEWQSRFE